jgi:hypothetical protein
VFQVSGVDTDGIPKNGDLHPVSDTLRCYAVDPPHIRKEPLPQPWWAFWRKPMYREYAVVSCYYESEPTPQADDFTWTDPDGSQWVSLEAHNRIVDEIRVRVIKAADLDDGSVIVLRGCIGRQHREACEKALHEHTGKRVMLLFNAS